MFTEHGPELLLGKGTPCFHGRRLSLSWREECTEDSSTEMGP